MDLTANTLGIIVLIHQGLHLLHPCGDSLDTVDPSFVKCDIHAVFISFR